MTRFVSVVSGKGGVGKTTVAVNLSAALHYFKREVILIDANTSTPNVCLQLGIKPSERELREVLKGKIKLTQAIYTHPSGLKVIPTGLSFHPSSRFLERFDSSLLDLVGTAEFVIIDSAPSLGKEARLVIDASDEVIVVTSPELPAVTDSLKTIEVARLLGKSLLGVVVNKFTGKPYEMKIDNIREFLGAPILEVIPEDEHVKRAIAMKEPVVFSAPRSKASVKFKKLAAKLIGGEYEYVEEVGLIDKVKSLFEKWIRF